MRNPKWQRDELILALDLYFRSQPGQFHTNNPQIIELSEILNKLPIHGNQKRNQKFRNPSGVSLKLSNFLAIDPKYKGKGMRSFGKLDKQIFEDFESNRQILHNIAEIIKASVLDSQTLNKLYGIEYEIEDELNMVREGKILYKLHKTKERNRKIVKRKKEYVKRKFGKLECEVCGFNFEDKYGDLGKGFIECHHIEPLSKSKPNKITKIEDLALVCSNCHSMLHGKISNLSIKELREIMKKKKATPNHIY